MAQEQIILLIAAIVVLALTAWAIRHRVRARKAQRGTEALGRHQQEEEDRKHLEEELAGKEAEDKARNEEVERKRQEAERLRMEAEAKARKEAEARKRREAEDRAKAEVAKAHEQAERKRQEEVRASKEAAANAAPKAVNREPSTPTTTARPEGEARDPALQLTDLEGLPDLPIGYLPEDPLRLTLTQDDYPIVELPLSDSIVKGTRIGKQGPRGVSENSFFNALQQHFPDSLLRDHRAEFTGASRDYEPDIILHFEVQALRIDIEIDEPYGLTTRKPMHWAGSYDDDRDLYFSNNGWVVVRFAEIQVVKQPVECVAFIAQLVRSINKSRSASTAAPGPIVDRIPRWSYEQAVSWAEAGYRESYLGITPPSVIEVDENEIAEIEADLEREPDQERGPYKLRNTGLATLTKEQQENKERIQQLIDQGAHARLTGDFGERLLKPLAIVKRRARHLVQAYDEVMCSDLQFDLRKISAVLHEPEPFRWSGRLEDLDSIAIQRLAHSVMGKGDPYLQIHYQKPAQAPELRTVSHITSFPFASTAMLVGHCEKRNAQRVFRKDRILGFKVLNLTYPHDPTKYHPAPIGYF